MTIGEYFTPEAAEALRRAIAENGGHELFCVGSLDEALKVCTVRVVARGNRNCVPAVLDSAGSGMMVVHNHPGGNLTPSENDVQLAAEFASRGVSSCIVDNAVEFVNVVVEPIRKRETRELSRADIVGVFAPGGSLAGSLEGYEHRPQQERMAEGVVNAFNQGQIALIEAATGVGKSLAYLVPAVHWARENRQRVVVSTNTINLQEQILYKDIPFLRRGLGLPFEAVLVKGRSNYLCLRKMEDVQRDPALFYDPEHAEELAALAEWARTTSDGSRSDLGSTPSWETWDLLASEGDACLFARCPHFGKCFFFQARRAAARADLIVTNHHLLMADMAVREGAGQKTGGVLPDFQKLILDEAHHVEDVAAHYFGVRVTPFGFSRNLARLQSPKDPTRGLLGKLHAMTGSLGGSDRTVADRFAGMLEDVVTTARAECRQRLDELFGRLAREVFAMREQPGSLSEFKIRVSRVTEGEPFWTGVLEPALAEAIACVEAFVEKADRLLRLLYKLTEESLDHIRGPLLDAEAVLLRLRAVAENLGEFLLDEPDKCRWLEVRRRREHLNIAFEQAPLDVARKLSKTVWDRYDSVVLTSATLSVGRSFAFIRERSGVCHQKPGRVLEMVLESPFDYGNRVLLGIPSDLPDPTARGFLDAATEAVRQAVHATGGGTFVLFTSYSHLSTMYRNLEGPLLASGFHLLRQGAQERHLLLEEFKKFPKAVLFAVDSFWEGVDVKGEALRSVIIVKLPFQVPSDPLVEARIEKIEREGGNAFTHYSLPHAVLRLKQGFGRLIRSQKDFGMVLICDNRVMTKHYGREFLGALPKCRPVYAPVETILREAVRLQASFGFQNTSGFPLR